jgi:hypothetical protein
MAESRLGGDVKAVFWFCCFLMVAAGLIDSGPVAWLLSPIILVGLVFCSIRAPLRHSYLALMFTALTIDYPNEALADGHYQTPLHKVGAALLDHLNNLTGIKALFFSGTDIIIGVLCIVAFLRDRSGARIDKQDRVPTPKPLVRLAWVALAGAGYVWIGGLVRGGDFSWSLWQLQKVVYLPVLFLICHLGLRGPKDHLALAKVVLCAATVRALLAIYIRRTVTPPPDPMTGIAVLASASGHADSMLFASAFILCVLLLIERVGKKATRAALWLLPILVMGMIANTRRLVWVHIALILVTLYFVTPDNSFKRKLRKTIVLSIPAVALYMAAGWNSMYGSFFKPVRIARSILEPASDASSLWRELENYNLIHTVKQSPIIGFGYGHRFIEALPLPSVNYSLEYYCPHNSLLGLWAFAGYIGYTAITLMWGVGVYYAMRGYHHAKAPSDRVTAIVCVGAVLVYLVQAFGDIGLGSFTGIYLLAPALAIAGKLAVATGSWGAARQPTAQQAPGAGGPVITPVGPPGPAPFARGPVR